MFVTSGITFNENRSEVAKLYISVDLCRREEGGGKSCQGAAFHTRWGGGGGGGCPPQGYAGSGADAGLVDLDPTGP